jgi:hypothetical protein
MTIILCVIFAAAIAPITPLLIPQASEPREPIDCSRSAFKLRELTCNEKPFLETEIGSEISQQLMQEYFKEQLI